MKTQKIILNELDTDRVIEMAWEDRTPFEAIEIQFGLTEKDVINLMRRQLKLKSFKLWRERAQRISHKHVKKRNPEMLGFKCKEQRQITLNKISKR
ncbi:TIGR03643 family protein [Pedobacter arcticus]|uniref:TIGR03643 family protein n=1 Tax=Pedobacter arcticus TaxID=752140 RepID=UPI0002F35979|nr:TIGR03643 family protein [Pedobacter arcticus]